MVLLAIPTVSFSSMFAMILGYAVPEFPGARWVSPVLGTVMYFWGGRPFLTGAISEIRSRTPGMMLLIGLAITVAFISSWGASLGVLDHQLDFWWELALLIVIMLLGHWIEMRSLAQTTFGAGLAGGTAARRGRAGRGRTRSSRSPRPICGWATSSSCGPAAACPPTARSSTAPPT